MNDAFGRLRVSSPYTIFEYYPNTGTVNNDYDADIFLSKGSGSGALTYNADENTLQLTCSTNGDKYTRFSKLPMEYQPGKSRLIYMSAIPISSVPTDTVKVRIGIFSLDGSDEPKEGFYFQISDTTLEWVYAYFDGTTQNYTTIAQSSWNIDTFDGNGPSGKTLTINSMTKNILFVIDQEWLGVGRIRVGFNLEGVNYYAHQFIPDFTYPYTTTPGIPLTYQISTPTTSNSYTLKQICCCSASEGDYIPLGRRIGIGTSVNTVLIPNALQKYIVIGLRIKAGEIGAILKQISSDVFFPKGGNNLWAKYELQVHSTGLGDYPVGGNIGATTGTITFTDIPKSRCQSFIPTGTLSAYVSTDGYVISKKYLLQNSQVNLDETQYSSLLTRKQISQYDTLYIVAKINSGTNIEIAASIDFLETS